VSTQISPTSGSATDTGPRDRFFSSSDGLRLHIRDYGDPLSAWTPVVCLPGLSRSHRDFHDLAMHLSGHRYRPRRVLCVNYRGRSLSQWDPKIENYNPVTEVHDVYDGLAALGIPRAIVVGASRGGILGMLMGTDRPSTVAGLIMVDIGPVINPLGLARIKSYIGQTPVPDSWDDAAQILKRLHGSQFTAWGPDDWQHFAHLTYRDEAGLPIGDYDPKLSETLAGIEFDEPLPDMWSNFRALADIPIQVIRGANSDLLAAQTVGEMEDAHPGLVAVEVADQGHCPVLTGPQILNRISSFITSVEGPLPPADALIAESRPAFDLDDDAAGSGSETGADQQQ
jgi:pimeloyl-ACP methyl ester carboxylesterase